MVLTMKPKPGWICQHCKKEFTTKYSLERHWRRFASHKGVLPDRPSRNSKVSSTNDEAQAAAVVVGVGQENQQPMAVMQTQSYQDVAPMPAPFSQQPSITATSASASDNFDAYQPEYHYHFQQQQTSSAIMDDPPHEPLTLPSVAVIEDTPRPPDAAAVNNYAASPSAQVAAACAEWEFPFLPPYLLENDEVLTNTPHVPFQSPPTEKKSPRSTYYNRIFANENSNPPFSSPLVPPYKETIGNGITSSTYKDPYFINSFYPASISKPSETKTFSSSQKKMPAPRSPVKLYDLDCKFLLGDEEATSPFSFMEKSSTISAPFAARAKGKATTSKSNKSANVSLTDSSLEMEFLSGTAST